MTTLDFISNKTLANVFLHFNFKLSASSKLNLLMYVLDSVATFHQTY